MVFVLFIYFFLILLNPVLEKLKNSIFEIPIISSFNFNHQWLENHKCKVYQAGYH